MVNRTIFLKKVRIRTRVLLNRTIWQHWEEADKVSGAAVDWDLLQVIDLTKPENDTSESLDIIFQDFYLADEENFLTLAEFITSFW